MACVASASGMHTDFDGAALAAPTTTAAAVAAGDGEHERELYGTNSGVEAAFRFSVAPSPTPSVGTEVGGLLGLVSVIGAFVGGVDTGSLLGLLWLWLWAAVGEWG